MADVQNGSNNGGSKVRRLSDAVRRVRIAEAERTDAFADLHDAERARLAMLADELKGVFAELPEDDYFICQMAGTTPPRLWIDPTSHVMIGRDRRTYRLLKDSRLGRIVMAETTDLSEMADLVTNYIAEKVIERDRVQEGDLLMAQLSRSLGQTASLPKQTSGASAKAHREGHGSAWAFAMVSFLLGAAAGAAGLIAYAWMTVPL